MGLKGGQGGEGGGKASASGIRAGMAWFELHVKDNITGALDKIQARVKRFGEFMKSIGTKFMLGGLALGAGPLALLMGGVNRLAETANLARQLKVPIDLMGRLQYAAEAAGVSVDEVMNDTQGRWSDLVNTAPGTDAEQAKQALATQKAFKDAIRALQDAMLPLLGTIAELATRASIWIQQNAAGVRVIAAASLGLLAFGVTAKVVGFGLTALAGTISLVSGLFAALLSPIGLVAAAVGGVTALILTQTQSGRALATGLGEAFQNLASTATEAWGGIVAAIGKGDLQGAFKIAGAAIRAIWYGMLIDMGKAFAAFVRENRDRIIALGAILGAIKGGTLGSAFGPVGTLIGGGLGAAGGGVAANELAKLVEGFGSLPGMEASRDAAAKELTALVNAAKAPGKPGGAAGPEPEVKNKSPGLAAVKSQFDAVKGGFNAFAARQQFGYGDEVTKQTELLKQMVALQKEAPAAIGAAIVAGMVL